MVKKSKSCPESAQAISLSYDLFELPTAQHKAGLAGLLLLARSLPADSERLDIEELTATTLRIRFTEQSLQSLFDDLYDAEMVEVAVASKWQGAAPKREETIEETDPTSGRAKKVKRFYYDVVQPKGRLLRECLVDEKGAWHKLWREMLWAVPRGKPTTRTPFNERAGGNPCSDAARVWKELVAFEKAKEKNMLRTCEVAGAILLGAQAVNAEGIPFQGRPDQNLLLHFWQLTVLTFVPQIVDHDGKADFAGYVLAIPEVSELKEFVRLFPRMLHELKGTTHGYRPAGAVIDLPEQGALEFMYNLARLSEQRVFATELRFVVRAVEFFHMVKLGNNVKTMAAGRISLRENLLAEYQGIRNEYRNPLFRSAALLALLRDESWYRPMARLFADRPWSFFVRSDDTPYSLPWFAADATARFRIILQDQQSILEEVPMNESGDVKPVATNSPTSLEVIVYRVVQTFVRSKADEKTGMKWDKIKEKTFTDEKTGRARIDVPEDYTKAQRKICSDAFLAFRSRRESDFVDYFTATIGSVGQRLSAEDYRVLAAALLRSEGPQNRDDVKTLAMLALSAAS
ncbi:MAG TPA: type I-MYXAN CRISPR-associated protein Cmx8 [Pirellulales bacterium]|nr:type I-MYXAN CRISPR-associated protein Cmx8 [Pirellulales bacterium]